MILGVYADDLAACLKRRGVAPDVVCPAVAGQDYAIAEGWCLRDQYPSAYLVRYTLRSHRMSEIVESVRNLESRLLECAQDLGYQDPIDLMLHKYNVTGEYDIAQPGDPGPFCVMRTWRLHDGGMWADVVMSELRPRSGRYLSPGLENGEPMRFGTYDQAREFFDAIQHAPYRIHYWPLHHQPRYHIMQVPE